MEKLYLTKNGSSQEVDLPNEKVTLTKQNFDLFNLDVAKAGYTKKIKLPKTSKNNSFFGFLSQTIHDQSPYENIRANFYVEGFLLIRNGKCYLDSVSDSYEIQIISDVLELEEILEDNISTVDFGEYTHSPQVITNQSHPNGVKFVTDADNLSNIRPSFYLSEFIKKALDNKGIGYSGIVADNDAIVSNYKTQTKIKNQSQALSDYNYRTPTPTKSIEQTSSWALENGTKHVQFSGSFRYYGNTGKQGPQKIDCYVYHNGILIGQKSNAIPGEGGGNADNLSYSGSFVTNQDTYTLTLTIVISTEALSNKGFSNHSVQITGTTYNSNYTKDLEETSIFELLKNYTKKNQLFYYYNGTRIEFIKFDDIKNATPEDWSSKYLYSKSISTEADLSKLLLFSYQEGAIASYTNTNQRALGSDDYITLDFKTSGNEGLQLRKTTTQRTRTITTPLGNEDCAIYDTDAPELIADIRDKYNDILNTITKPKVVEAYFNLTSHDFHSLDFKSLKYVKQLNGYYYIQEATYKQGHHTKTKLILIR